MAAPAPPCTVAGMECTGSTFVFNIIRGMTGRTPVKTHDYAAPGPLTPLIIVTYRDPRDILCSYARRQLKGITDAAGIQTGLLMAYKTMFTTQKRHEALLRFRDDGVLLLKYESVSSCRLWFCVCTFLSCFICTVPAALLGAGSRCCCCFCWWLQAADDD
jgi:hypothetical protein